MQNYFIELTHNVPRWVEDYTVIEERDEEYFSLTQLVSEVRSYFHVLHNIWLVVYALYLTVVVCLIAYFGLTKGTFITTAVLFLACLRGERNRRYYRLISKHPLYANRTTSLGEVLDEGVFIEKSF